MNVLQNVKLILALMGTTLFISKTNAVDWIYDYTKGGTGNITWSNTLGTEGVANSGNWYYVDSNSQNVYMSGSYSDKDTFTLGSATITSSITMTLDKNLVCSGFNFIAADKYPVKVVGSNSSIVMTVNGNVTDTTNTAVDGIGITNLNLDITGSITSGSRFQANGLYSFNVGGEIISTKTPVYKLGSSIANSSISSPDAIIAGAVSGYHTAVLAGYAKNVYYSIGGFSTGSGMLKIENTSNKNAITSIILTQGSGKTYSAQHVSEIGGFNGNTIYVNPLEHSRGTIIMNGEGKQIFGSETDASNLMISGGITVNNGTLSISFCDPIYSTETTNPNSWKYKYLANYQKSPELAKATYAVSYFTSNTEGALRTTFSHGDLNMNGGTFSSIYSTKISKDFSNFRFTNIVYSGGIIKLQLKDASNYDSLDLTSYYMYEENNANAEENYYTKQIGGTIKLADGTDAGTKVFFDLGGVELLDWLLDSGDGEFNINGGKGVRVVAWDKENKTKLLSSDFAANHFLAGDDYDAVFTVADDGLYVRYMLTVPEPASFVIILSSIMLGIALYRRHK